MARKKQTPKPTPEMPVTAVQTHRPDPASGGQSGDLQGLSDRENVDSESVRELVEEGQFYEAAIVSAVEDAPNADAGPLRPRRRPEDDLPPEYADKVPDEPQE